ncbi:MAG TPA: pteridine reductase [Gammaproteobacteria bacterium]|nr:pteridine reductase [Gammaproteobacteria bacterium]
MSARTLSGKTALVTGAARRLGAGIARALHAAGANLIVHYRESAEDAQRLCAELNAARPSSAHAIGQDLVDTSRLARLVDAALERTGRLDVLVNNASTFYPTPLGAIDEAQWDDLIGTNLKAPLFLAQSAAPALAVNHGVIINMLDVHARRPLRGHPVYCAAKAGLAMLTRSLARELGPAVRVNGVAPGTILWPVQGLDERIKAQIIGETALKRQGSVADVADCVVYLARDAVYVTGEIITVDGGRSLGW